MSTNPKRTIKPKRTSQSIAADKRRERVAALKRAGKGNAAIARELGVHRNTIINDLNALEAAGANIDREARAQFQRAALGLREWRAKEQAARDAVVDALVAHFLPRLSELDAMQTARALGIAWAASDRSREQDDGLGGGMRAWLLAYHANREFIAAQLERGDVDGAVATLAEGVKAQAGEVGNGNAPGGG